MSGTHVQNVSVVSVSSALSMSAWETAGADWAAGLGLSSFEPPHAARNQVLEAAAAVEIKNFRRVNGVADIAVLSIMLGDARLVEVVCPRGRWNRLTAGERDRTSCG